MKLNFRRLLAMFLSIMMVVGMLPAAVFAEDGVETQSETYVAQVGEAQYTDLQEAIKAAAPAGTVEILSDITVDQWIMFAETMNISNGKLITLNINGLTINGNNHTLTINSIESAGNGGRLFYDAQNLTVKDLTINIADGLVGGIGLQSGTISNVTFNGGQYAVLPGSNGVTITGCTFNDTTGYAIYYEDARPGIVVTGNSFNTASGAYAITMRDNEQFTGNIITTGRVNLANSAKSIVTGNNFGTERFKVYNEATATISNNEINNLVFNDATVPQSTFTNNTLNTEAQAALDAVTAPAVVVVTTYEELIAALAGDVKSIKMMNNITATATQISGYGKAGIVINAGYTLDGNGYTLTINGANATWDCAIAMRGGEVKNLTIAGAMRGVFMPGADGDVVIDNCVFKDVIYTFNSDGGSKEHSVTIKNTTLNGWTSFSNVHKSVTFEKCTFGEGFGNAFCRPYQATTFVDCGFEAGYKLDTVNVKGGSENLVFNGCTYAGEALSAKNNAMFPDGGKVIINGVSTDVTNYPPTGSNSYAYTTEDKGYVHVWGEGRGNAKESYVLKLYSGDTLIATTKLNNVGGIIDGDVYVTWHFYYPKSTDEYWTTTWEEGHPNADAQPTKVELWIDGTLVATTEAKMSGADGVNPVVWSELGGVKKIVTGLSGEGTAEDPYLINNLEELKWFRDSVNKGNRYNGQFVKLNADIDLNDEEWTPIGDRNVDQGSFLGTFDGGDHTISNLWISQWNKTGAGFFSKVGMQTESVSGTVKNVIFNNVTITSTNSYVGVIAQAPLGALIENVEITGKVAIQGYGYVGGIVGHGYPTINNCSVKADKNSTITATYWGAGAILGFAGDYGAKISNATVSDVAIHAASGGAASVAGSPYGAALTGTTNVKNVNITSNSDYCMSYVAGGGKINGTVVMENVTATASGKAITPGDVVASVDGTMYFDLQSALAAAAAGTGNVTVEILRDVNLTGIDWNPVTVSANGYPVVTVNGNNKTITGLNDMLFAGTWAGKSGLIINDLTIKDSKIVNDKDDTAGTVGVGAFIGYPQASATITLSNCHLVNSIVEGGHWTGGLIGMAGGYNGNDGPVFMNLTITGCSVTGSTITGKGSAGGVIGHGSCAAWTNVVIENTTVSGNTITSTGSSTNKAGSVMGTIGAAGQPTTVNGVTLTGGAFVSATVSGNTVTSAGTTITTIYGRQGTVGGTLEVTGGSYDKYPIEENVSYAAPAEGYVIEENADGTYGLVIAPTSKTYNVSTKAELDAALAAAAEGDTILLTADIDYGTDHLAITQAITLDLGTHTLTTKATNYGLALKNDGCIVTNGKLNHAGTVAAIKVWDAAEISDLEIDVIGTSSSGNTIDGIVIQQNAAGVDLIQKVTIHSTSGQGVDSGIKTYNCGNATEPVIGSMVNVTIDAKSVGLNISAPCGTATNCTIKGGTNGIEIWIKGTYSATLDLVDCDVVGGVFAHDEFSSNPSIVNNGTLELTADGATTGASKDDITLTIARAENVEGILKEVMNNAQAKVNDTYYATLQAAIDAAKTGEIVKLLTNVTLTESITVAADDVITIDLNGHNLTNVIPTPTDDSTPCHTILNKGNLTVIDSVGGGKMQSNSAKGYVIYTEGGKLTVDGAKIVGINKGYALVTWTAGDSITIKEGTVVEGRGALYIDGGATGTVSGGTFTMTVQTTNPQDNVVYVGGASELTIDGGNFSTGKITGNQRLAIAVLNPAKVTINGGTFYGLTGDIQSRTSAGNVVVNGGTFNGTTMDERIDDSIALKGGTYKYDPTTWLAEGYKATDNNGTWDVAADPAEGKVAKIGNTYYETFAAALDAVQDGDTITVLDAEGSERTTEIDFDKAINFTITGNSDYELPTITFTNATVNIEDANIEIGELDARQNATINVKNSTVETVGTGSTDGIVKAYYNGKINIEDSEVYAHQFTVMGVVNLTGSSELTVTWQTNVYGNGLINIGQDATLNTAAMHLTGKDYSGRDNTDADRVGKPAQITVDGGTLNIGTECISINGANYNYLSSEGINIGTIAGKKAVLDILNGAKVNIYMADGENANIGANGTVKVNGELTVGCRDAAGTAKLVNNGSIVLKTVNSTVTANECGKVTTDVEGYEVTYADDKYVLKKFELKEFFGTNLTLGNELDINFAFSTSYVDQTGYAVIVREYADDRADETLTINLSDCTISGKYYVIKYAGIAAKEMCDEVKVTIYDANGKQISITKTDSIRDYILRNVDKENIATSSTRTAEETRTLLIDMLNYGAAAQVKFNYNTADLANSTLTDAQKAYGTQIIPTCKDNRSVSGVNVDAYYGTQFVLESKISMQIAIKTSAISGGTATINFVDHYGVSQTVTINAADCTTSGSYTVFTIDKIVVADGRCDVTCVFKNAAGDEVVTVVDSLESYVARNANKNSWLYEIMKFSDAAYASLH